MFLLRRPTPQIIERFVSDAREASLSYSPIGIANSAPPGFDCDETMTAIGRGRTDFERARAAVHAWAHFDIGWVEIFPPARIATGTAVAVLVQYAGVWSLNACRIVFVIDEPDRAGFAYGTLADHAERGEELFEVSLDPETDVVTYRIRAVSRPRAAVARLGYPIVRMLQSRFRRDSAAAMARRSSSSRSARR